MDRVYLISDWYCWATLGSEAWMSRPKVDSNSGYPEINAGPEKDG